MKVERTFEVLAPPAAQWLDRRRGGDGCAPRLRGAVAGRLTDHYDPRSKTLNLSADVGRASSLAAVGVAALEAGHAIQDARGYRPMRIRQTLVPAATIGQSLWFLPVVIGLFIGATGLVTVGLVLFAAVVLFQLARCRSSSTPRAAHGDADDAHLTPAFRATRQLVTPTV